jgi:predicted ATPase
MSDNKQAYISQVHLKGYKSIKDLTIDFKPGLNVVIGPNGSGKTNFVDFISFLNRNGYENELYQKTVEAKLNYKNVWQLDFKGILKYGEPLKDYFIHLDKQININTFLEKKEGKLVFEVNESVKTTTQKFDFERTYHFSGFKKDLVINETDSLKPHHTFTSKKIGFNNPINSIDSNSTIELIGVRNNAEREDIIIKSAFENIEYRKDTQLDGLTSLILYLWEEIDYPFYVESFIQDFSKNLPKYSPIHEVVINKKRLIVQTQGNELKLSNLIDSLDFRLNDKDWFNWRDLSDGTKRLFYIICEICSFDKLVFLEEPELGIHPDQLYKLMDFLVEQSKEKQIIITTHSPEVLNAISPDELDRIIVTRFDAKKGTIMRKLSPDKAKEIGERIKKSDMFLSDHWVHQGLEDDIFNAENDENQTH